MPVKALETIKNIALMEIEQSKLPKEKISNPSIINFILPNLSEILPKTGAVIEYINTYDVTHRATLLGVAFRELDIIGNSGDIKKVSVPIRKRIATEPPPAGSRWVRLGG